MKIAINAQINPGSGAGGVESVLTGLIKALGELTDGQEEYIIIGPHENPEWLHEFTGSNQKVIRGPPKKGLYRLYSYSPQFLKNFLLKHRSYLYRCRKWPELPISDGFYENLGCDIIHFPYQHFVLCAIPTLFNPHDLQHIHFPSFFSPCEIANREVVYRQGCNLANIVVVASNWVKNDIVKNYGINEDKIINIPWAPPTFYYQKPDSNFIAQVEYKYSLSKPFVFYPAATWRHKNHIRLLEAIAQIRERTNIKIQLVCTGFLTDYWPIIQMKIKELNLEDQTKFLGVITKEELRAVYNLADFVIIPTLFEAASGPLFESWNERVPVTCSAVTSLPEQASDAAYLFNPLSIDEIANALILMTTDRQLKSKLVLNGERRLEQFSWEKTAKTYRALYRKMSGKKLNDEELILLEKGWIDSYS